MRELSSDITDRELFVRFSSRDDHQAFQQLFDRHWKSLYAKAFARLNQEQEAKDCVQEVFVQLWIKRSSLEIPVSVPAYLSVCVRNSVFNYYKNLLAREKLANRFALVSDTEFVDSSELEIAEFSNLIQTEIDQMPDQMRRIFLLSREEEMSGTEIADMLNLSHQTVRNHITMALKRLRLQIQRYQLH